MCGFSVKVPLRKGDLGGSPQSSANRRSPNPLKKGAKNLKKGAKNLKKGAKK
jgi:hypothetical protein